MGVLSGQAWDKLLWTNISHLWKRNVIFPTTFKMGYMRSLEINCLLQKLRSWTTFKQTHLNSHLSWGKKTQCDNAFIFTNAQKVTTHIHKSLSNASNENLYKSCKNWASRSAMHGAQPGSQTFSSKSPKAMPESGPYALLTFDKIHCPVPVQLRSSRNFSQYAWNRMSLVYRLDQ